MNADKIYAEQLANEYAPKDTSKVVALRKPDNKVDVKELSTAQQVLRLIDKLEDLDDVQAVHSNAEIAEDVLDQIAAQED